MSNRKYRIHYNPSCWNCRKLRKSKRKIDGDTNKGAISISAPSFIDALAGYYCDSYWFTNKPDALMPCGGRGYESVYKQKQQ